MEAHMSESLTRQHSNAKQNQKKKERKKKKKKRLVIFKTYQVSICSLWRPNLG
jgi:ribosomal protein L18